MLTSKRFEIIRIGGKPAALNSYSHGQPKPSYFLVPERIFFAPKWLQIQTQGSQNIRKWLQLIFPTAFWGLPNFEPKKMTLLLPCTSSVPISGYLLCQNTTVTYKTRCGGLAWGWHWRRAKSTRLFFIVPQIIMHCHRFTLNGSFCMLSYARTCNIFVILTPRSNSGIKKELIAHLSVFLANY